MATLSLRFMPPEYLRHCLSATPLSQRLTLLKELSTACNKTNKFQVINPSFQESTRAKTSVGRVWRTKFQVEGYFTYIGELCPFQVLQATIKQKVLPASQLSPKQTAQKTTKPNLYKKLSLTNISCKRKKNKFKNERVFDVLMLGADTHARVDAIHFCKNVHPLYICSSRGRLQKTYHLQ
jgi:hypothetical protein